MKPELKNADKSRLKETCSVCSKGVKKGLTGSLTGWLFKDSVCSCPPAVRAAALKPTDPELTLVLPRDQDTESDYPTLPPGTIVSGRYEIKSVIGVGGMGAVYSAYDKFLKRSIALKILHPHLAQRELIIRRFSQEINAISKLVHENIVSIHDCGLAEMGAPYMVMDLLPGVSLDKMIEKEGAFNEEQALDIAIKIASATMHAHKNGIIHRDLKPSNILLHKSEDGTFEVKLVDFGIAKLIDENPLEAKLTQTGDVFGSPQYMSPEQCQGEKLDTRSDIYAIGCILYEMLAGRPPFSAENAVKTILLQISEPPPPFSSSAKCSEAYKRITLKCLEKKPSNRYATADALLAHLKLAKQKKRVWIVKKLTKKEQAILCGTAAVLGCYLSADFISTESDRIISEWTGSWSGLDRLGQNKLNRGDIEGARSLLSKALQLSFSTDHEKVLSLQKLALIAHMEGKKKEEQEFDERTKRILKTDVLTVEGRRDRELKALMGGVSMLSQEPRKNLSPDETTLIRTVNEFATNAIDDGANAQVQSLLESTVARLKASHQTEDVPYAQTLANLSEVLLPQRRYEQAAEYAKTAEKIFLKKSQESSPERIRNLIQMACIENSHTHGAQSEKFALRAIDALNAAKLQSNELWGKAEWQLANSLALNRKFDRSLVEFDKAFNYLNKCEKWTLAKSCSEDMIERYYELGRHENLEKKLKQLIAEAEKSADALKIAAYKYQLGDYYAQEAIWSGQTDACEQLYIDALKLAQHAALPTSAEVRRYLKGACYASVSLHKDQPTLLERFKPDSLVSQWIASVERAGGNYYQLAHARSYLAWVRISQGDKTGARELLAKIMNDPEAVTFWANSLSTPFFATAEKCFQADDWEKLHKLLNSRLEYVRVKYGENSFATAQALDDLGHYQWCRGNLRAARALIGQAVETLRKNRNQLTRFERDNAAQTFENLHFAMIRLGEEGADKIKAEARAYRQAH